jgi:hypothetical protein
MASKKEYHRKNYLYEAAHNMDVSIPRRTLKRMQDVDASASSSGIELGKFSSFQVYVMQMFPMIIIYIMFRSKSRKFGLVFIRTVSEFYRKKCMFQ